MRNLLSLEDARDRMSRIGRTAADVAKELNVDVQIVRGVLTGRLKGTHGDAHKVAVALCIKQGIVVPKELPVADALKAVA